jgi:hypothetical protein
VGGRGAELFEGREVWEELRGRAPHTHTHTPHTHTHTHTHTPPVDPAAGGPPLRARVGGSVRLSLRPVTREQSATGELELGVTH